MFGRKKTSAASASGGNPFLTHGPSATGSAGGGTTQVLDREAAEGDDLGDLGELSGSADSVMLIGPGAPTGAPAPARPPLRMPTLLVDPPHGSVVQLVGLHGGAGVSTLAAVLGDGVLDAGVGLDLAAAGVPVVLVARTHAAGLEVASRAARQWASGGLVGLPLLGAVLVDDGPRVSEPMTRAARSVGSAFPRTWRVEWVESWRAELAPTEVPTRVRRARKSLLGEAERFSRMGSKETHINNQEKEAIQS